MKKKIVSMLVAFTVVSALMTGCGGTAAANGAAAPEAAEEAVTEEAAEAAEEAAPEEAAEATEEAVSEEAEVPAGEEDGYYGPEDFVQEQSGKTEFTDYEDVIANLKDGQGYAYIQVYGYDGDVLAVSDSVFLADHSAADATLYAMQDGKPKSLGIVAGNGSAYPLRIADGIIYSGDNHNYETYFMNTSGGIPGIMAKDVVYDGIDGDGSFGGFLREDNTFGNDKDFTGGQEEFDALIKDRESKPIIEFTIVGAQE